jgi:predicted dehydrogenase
MADMGIDSIKSATPEGAMRIAVIGAGNIGRTLGAKWAVGRPGRTLVGPVHATAELADLRPRRVKIE